MTEMACPKRMICRRPKISLRLPANVKATEEAIDHPDTIQPILPRSLKSSPIFTSTDVMRRKPQDIGATGDKPRNFAVESVEPQEVEWARKTYANR